MKKILSAALALVLVFTMSLSAFASYGFNGASLPDTVVVLGTSYGITEYMEMKGYKNVVVYSNLNTGATQLWFIESDIYISDSKLEAKNSSGGKMIFSLPSHKNYWEFYSTGTSGSPVLYTQDLYWSLNDIYDSTGSSVMFDGENFPEAPLAELIQGVTNQALVEEMEKMSQTVRLLTVCGIGSMALLIGLSLFGKRSLLFRS